MESKRGEFKKVYQRGELSFLFTGREHSPQSDIIQGEAMSKAYTTIFESKGKPIKWEAPTEEAGQDEEREKLIVWANSYEEAERMEKMSIAELRAYLKERDGAKNE